MPGNSVMRTKEIFVKNRNLPSEISHSEEAYQELRGYVINAQSKIYNAVNTAMIEAYWKIGKKLYDTCGDERATYGKQILQYVSEKLTKEFGNGFSVRNLQRMRQFYLTFANTTTLWTQLS